MTVQQQIDIAGNYDRLFELKLNQADDIAETMLNSLSRDLYTVLNDYLLEFNTTANVLDFSVLNLTKAAQFDKVFDAFSDDIRRTLELRLVPQVEIFYDLAKDYYTQLGFANATILANQIKPVIFAAVGLTETGKIVQGGIIDNLATMDAIRPRVKDLVTGAISAKTSLKKLQTDLKASILPSAKQDGALLRQYKVQAFDLFNQIHEIANKELAVELGLQYFIYQGSIITTSRAFCTRRAGKVFSTKDAKKWATDPTLQIKNKATYDPLIHRGGYRCRHWIRYISEEAALKLGYKE